MRRNTRPTNQARFRREPGWEDDGVDTRTRSTRGLCPSGEAADPMMPTRGFAATMDFMGPQHLPYGGSGGLAEEDFWGEELTALRQDGRTLVPDYVNQSQFDTPVGCDRLDPREMGYNRAYKAAEARDQRAFLGEQGRASGYQYIGAADGDFTERTADVKLLSLNRYGFRDVKSNPEVLMGDPFRTYSTGGMGPTQANFKTYEGVATREYVPPASASSKVFGPPAIVLPPTTRKLLDYSSRMDPTSQAYTAYGNDSVNVQQGGRMPINAEESCGPRLEAAQTGYVPGYGSDTVNLQQGGRQPINADMGPARMGPAGPSVKAAPGLDVNPVMAGAHPRKLIDLSGRLEAGHAPNPGFGTEGTLVDRKIPNLIDMSLVGPANSGSLGSGEAQHPFQQRPSRMFDFTVNPGAPRAPIAGNGLGINDVMAGQRRAINAGQYVFEPSGGSSGQYGPAGAEVRTRRMENYRPQVYEPAIPGHSGTFVGLGHQTLPTPKLCSVDNTPEPELLEGQVYRNPQAPALLNFSPENLAELDVERAVL